MEFFMKIDGKGRVRILVFLEKQRLSENLMQKFGFLVSFLQLKKLEILIGKYLRVIKPKFHFLD